MGYDITVVRILTRVLETTIFGLKSSNTNPIYPQR